MAPANNGSALFMFVEGRRRELMLRTPGARTISVVGLLDDKQNRAILILSLTCASMSLLGTMIAFIWFIRMRRSFRHRLVVFLIMGDLLKALTYFIFPLVTFLHGPLSTSSPFCQISGFVLNVGIEAADVAVLAIALHTALHIFRPSRCAGEGGLYRYRRALYAAYILWPILSASLSFVNPRAAFVNFQIYCTLPKRPFYYRLALSWIPRYMIFITVVCIYASIYVYVRSKFHGFDNLGSCTRSMSAERESTAEYVTEQLRSQNDPESPRTLLSNGASASRKASVVSAIFLINSSKPEPDSQNIPEYEQIDIITAPEAVDISKQGSGVSSSDFAACATASKALNSVESCHPEEETHIDEKLTRPSIARTMSEARTIDTECTMDADTTFQEDAKDHSTLSRNKPRPSQLARTRRAIRRQLRFMFIYPLVYIAMWTLPFVAHCFNYSDWWTAHEPFSLTVAATACLSLQAGADSLVFSWRERPWRRTRAPKPDWVKRLFDRTIHIYPHGIRGGGSNPSHDEKQIGSRPKLRDMRRHSSIKGQSIKPEKHWWEAEGRRRKDSVWMGTDSHNSVSRLSSEPSPAANTQAEGTEQKKPCHTRSRSADVKKFIHSRSQSTIAKIVPQSIKES